MLLASAIRSHSCRQVQNLTTPLFILSYCVVIPDCAPGTTTSAKAMGAQQDPEVISRTPSRRRVPPVDDFKLRDQAQGNRETHRAQQRREDMHQGQYGDNNPACVPPASMAMRPPPARHGSFSVSTPSGETETVRQDEGQSNGNTQPSKYEVGWRRVVRNFSPS